MDAECSSPFVQGVVEACDMGIVFLGCQQDTAVGELEAGLGSEEGEALGGPSPKGQLEDGEPLERFPRLLQPPCARWRDEGLGEADLAGSERLHRMGSEKLDSRFVVAVPAI